MPATKQKNFRHERLRKGWSQRRLVEECRLRGVKVDQSTIARIEVGETLEPRPELRAVLCELLDLPIDYFDKRGRA